MQMVTEFQKRACQFSLERGSTQKARIEEDHNIGLSHSKVVEVYRVNIKRTKEADTLVDLYIVRPCNGIDTDEFYLVPTTITLFMNAYVDQCAAHQKLQISHHFATMLRKRIKCTFLGLCLGLLRVLPVFATIAMLIQQVCFFHVDSTRWRRTIDDVVEVQSRGL